MATREQIDYIQEQAQLVLDQIEQMETIVGTLETEAASGMSGGIAYRNLLLISGQTDPSSSEVQPNQGILNRTHEIDSNLVAMIATLEALKATASGIDEVRIDAMIETLKEKKNEAQTQAQRVTTVSDKLQQPARDYFAMLVNLVQSARETGVQPLLYANLSDDDKQVFQSINPEEYEYLESLPKPEGQNTGSAGGTIAGAQAGSGGGSGGAGGTGGGGATTTPPKKQPLATVGSINGVPVYDPTQGIVGTGQTDLASNPEGYNIQIGAGNIQFIPTGDVDREPGETSTGFGFSYDALRDGAIDLTKFDGEIREQLQELKDQLIAEEEANQPPPWDRDAYNARKAAGEGAARRARQQATQPVEEVVAPLIAVQREIGRGVSRSRQV